MPMRRKNVIALRRRRSMRHRIPAGPLAPPDGAPPNGEPVAPGPRLPKPGVESSRPGPGTGRDGEALDEPGNLGVGLIFRQAPLRNVVPAGHGVQLVWLALATCFGGHGMQPSGPLIEFPD
jgi:hypothetical protein